MKDGCGPWILELGQACVRGAPGGRARAGPAGRRATWRKVDLAGAGAGWPAAPGGSEDPA